MLVEKVYIIQNVLYSIIRNISSITTEKAIHDRQWEKAYSELEKDIKGYEERITLLKQAQNILKRVKR